MDIPELVMSKKSCFMILGSKRSYTFRLFLSTYTGNISSRVSKKIVNICKFIRNWTNYRQLGEVIFCS